MVAPHSCYSALAASLEPASRIAIVALRSRSLARRRAADGALMAIRARLARRADGGVERLQHCVELLLAVVCEVDFALMK